jgi:predicted O-linked N-acetylglucosamine transferase (SPINDLY family)
MRGADWRQKVVDTVENFIDCSAMGLGEIAELIKEYGIHILLNWDGYAHNGIRKDGLFALKPSPIQISQQEYISTTGEVNIDYIVTDQKASPVHLHHLYTEKFLYMPHTFLVNSFAYQVRFLLLLLYCYYCYYYYNYYYYYNWYFLILLLYFSRKILEWSNLS